MMEDKGWEHHCQHHHSDGCDSGEEQQLVVMVVQVVRSGSW
jgi:hypothetical protein